jgi:hypothetical protein
MQARVDFETALRLQRNDPAVRERLDLTNEVLLLDPMARGLHVAERYRRSTLLLKRTLDELNGCAGPNRPQPIADLIARSDKALKNRVLPSDEGDALDANLDLALELWKARGSACGPVTESEQPVALVLALAEMSR